MFCKKCGKALNNWDLVCPNCREKVESTNNIVVENNLNDNKNNAINSIDNIKKILNNKAVYILFEINMILLVIGVVISLFKPYFSSSGGSGWFIIIFPVAASMLACPQAIGVILSRINIKRKSYKMLFFIFLFSIISLVTTIYSLEVGNNGILFWICIVLNIFLCVIILLKLILKIKE